MSMSTKLLLLLVLLDVTILSSTQAKVLSQCEAANALKEAGVERSFISTYVCIMKSETGFNTRKKTGPGYKASYSYGVFQISSDKWCSAFRKDGICKAHCNDFLNDDIRDDIMCARHIAATEGFKHWKGWRKNCKGVPLPNVAPCFKKKRSLGSSEMDIDENELVE